MQQEKTDIKSMNLEELKSYMESIGEKPFRAKQLYQWMHEKLASSFDDMTNLSKVLRQKLQDACEYVSLEKVRVQISQIDGTRKYLFRLADGNVIESVLMRYKHGNSVCISSQVGCKMGCRFCASTIGGWTRNLLPSEMLDQIYRIQSIMGEREPANLWIIMIILYALYICFPMKMVLTSARGISPYRPAELFRKFMSLQNFISE